MRAVCAFAVVFSAFSGRAATVTFKEKACIKGPTITLGDIAEVEGDGAQDLRGFEVGPAPSAACPQRIETALILARMKHAGIGDVETNGARAVLLTATQRQVTREAIAESLRQYIECNLPWDPLTSQVDVSLPVQDTVVPEGEMSIKWQANPNYKYIGETTFRGAILVDGQSRKSVLCRAKVEAYADVLIAVRAIAAGQTVAAPDLKKETRALSTLKEAPLTDIGGAGSCVASRAIAAGEVLGHKSIAARQIVKRKQTVTVLARAGTLGIETQAVAETDGASGETVTCTNPSSKQTFQGVVREDGVVVVDGGGVE
jgi:flagellar basal body P-ring formation protein FlgA